MRTRGAVELLCLGLIVAAAVGLAASTHGVFSATMDEPLHIFTGLERFEGNYRLTSRWPGRLPPQGRIHILVDPPIAALAMATGPYLHGLRAADAGLAGPRHLLYEGEGYRANLASARRGILPFLALAICLTWALAHRLFGREAALASAAALASVPPFLGHGGLATTDIAFSSMVLLMLLTALWWMERTPGGGRPAWRRTLALGFVLGVSVSTKLSALVVLPGLFLVAAARQREQHPDEPARAALRRLAAATWRRAGHAGVAAALAALVVWGFYGLTWASPHDAAGAQVSAALIGDCLHEGPMRRFVAWLAGKPLPAPDLFNGFLLLCGQNSGGHSTSYLMGQISQRGFPQFFPIALAVKTPLPFIALAGVGVAACARDHAAPSWRRWAPLIVATWYLLFLLTSKINVGVRHALPIVPLLAIYAGLGAVALWRARRHARVARVTAVALGAWLVSTPARAAPELFTWFNGLAGQHPEDVLLDSDLDWGQDLLRLEDALARHHVERLSIAYFGASELCRHRLPSGRWLKPYEPTTGWIAISEEYLKGVIAFHFKNGDYCDASQLASWAAPDPKQYAWLEAYQPVERVGRSILLYHIPEGRAP